MVPVPQTVIQLPVEVIEKGNAPEWIYVHVGHEAVPEPGSVSLVVLAGLLVAFRRQRK